MSHRYENPILYSSINQPVDKKTGLIVQQEIPLYQLGRNREKYDQGFLEVAADRALAEHYGKKRKRCTAVFLPDRVRFTVKKFRRKLFYREIKMFYKSDPKTFCFILYVIDEKTAKRYYEVYQCDNMEDVRRIEDLLEISKYTVNRLLLDPVPDYKEIRRRSLPVESIKHQSYPESFTQEAFECPHCQRISRVAPDPSVAAVSETPSEAHTVTRRRNNNMRSKSTMDLTGNESRDWLRVRDQWRENDFYGYYTDSWNRKPRRNHHPMSVHTVSNWGVYDHTYGNGQRRTNRQTVPQLYRTDKQIKPQHTASTYGRPIPANIDQARMRILQNGKPYLNRQTMQVMDPYMEPVYSRARRHHRSLPARADSPPYEELEKNAKSNSKELHEQRPNDKKLGQKEEQSSRKNEREIIVPPPIFVQHARPTEKSSMISKQEIPSVSLEPTHVSMVNNSKPDRYKQANMFLERTPMELVTMSPESVKVQPVSTMKQAKPMNIHSASKTSHVLIEYEPSPTTVSKPYVYPTVD